MFGKPAQDNRDATPPRPTASEIAQIQGGGLVQVILTSLSPLTYYVFLNNKAIPQIDIESLSVSIEAPDDGSTPTVRATLAMHAKVVTGEKMEQRMELFPSTLEIVALGRRIAVTCMNPDSLDGLWISLGLKPDGTSNDLTGVKELRILITEGIVDAKLTWVDGEAENLFPHV